MATAVVSLAAYLGRQAWERFRDRAHEALDEFLDRLEERMSTPESSPATLLQVTEAILQERSGFTGALVEAFVERLHEPYLAQAETAHSWACGRRDGLLSARMRKTSGCLSSRRSSAS